MKRALADVLDQVEKSALKKLRAARKDIKARKEAYLLRIADAFGEAGIDQRLVSEIGWAKCAMLARLDPDDLKKHSRALLAFVRDEDNSRACTGADATLIERLASMIPGTLRDPSSLEIHAGFLATNHKTMDRYACFEISARNGFGGLGRSIVMPEEDGTVWSSQDDIGVLAIRNMCSVKNNLIGTVPPAPVAQQQPTIKQPGSQQPGFVVQE
jgi:hypothetical protein